MIARCLLKTIVDSDLSGNAPRNEWIVNLLDVGVDLNTGLNKSLELDKPLGRRGHVGLDKLSQTTYGRGGHLSIVEFPSGDRIGVSSAGSPTSRLVLGASPLNSKIKVTIQEPVGSLKSRASLGIGTIVGHVPCNQASASEWGVQKALYRLELDVHLNAIVNDPIE